MRIHLAGLDDLPFIRMALKAHHPYGLTTYFKLKDWPQEKNQRHIQWFNDHDTEMILDSGLFTMMFGAEKDRTYDLPFMLDYTKKYIEDVKSYGFKRLTIVECDVHKILGLEALFELRQHFRASGIPTIYVWHVEETIAGLMKLAASEKYIALSVPELRIFFSGKGVTYKRGVFDLLSRISKHCDEIGVPLPKIHLLGNTVEATMRTRLAYSCDSTSWIAGVKYGQGLIYRNGTLKKVHIRSKAFEQMKELCSRERPDVVEFVNSIYATDTARTYYFNLFVAADAYKKYQDWLDAHYTWKGKENADPS